MKVAVVGLGYVGAVSAACLAAHGHEVCGLDTDPAKVAAISAGRSPVAEPGLADVVAAAVGAGQLHATTDTAEALGGAEVSLVCVGTPSAAGGETDLSYLTRAVAGIVAALAATPPPGPWRHLIVIRSTAPPGTAEDLVLPMVRNGLAGTGRSAAVAVYPEFLREGSGLADFLAPPLTVIGAADPADAEIVASLFSFIGQPAEVTGIRSAEAVKYACNAFHAMKVSFANEMGRLMRPLGVDARTVMDLLCHDRALNLSASYLRPGFAFGGSCLPKDLRSALHLAAAHDADLPLLRALLPTNDLVISDVAARVAATGTRSVALLGLSFKPDTDDVRESPSVRLAERLISGGAEVAIYDRLVRPACLLGANRRYLDARLPRLEQMLVHDPAEALRGRDTAVVAVSEPAVVAALRERPPRYVIDLDGRLGPEIEALPGYQGIGW